MLVKWIGSILIILFSGYIGYIFSRDCSRRPQELRELQVMFQMLENEISYLSNLLADAFETIYKNTGNGVSTFFKATAERLSRGVGISAQEAWEQSVRENINKTSLNSEDLEVLLSFGRMLGSSEVEGQVKNIRLCINKLKLQEQMAEEARRKNEKMYRSLGILCGLAVVIILI